MTTIKGLTSEQFKMIFDIIKTYSEYEFFIYGSRVIGNFSKNSDLDLLIKGKDKISLEVIEELKEKFDKSSLSFIVHIADSYGLDHKFFELIQKYMVKIC